MTLFEGRKTTSENPIVTNWMPDAASALARETGQYVQDSRGVTHYPEVHFSVDDPDHGQERNEEH